MVPSARVAGRRALQIRLDQDPPEEFEARGNVVVRLGAVPDEREDFFEREMSFLQFRSLFGEKGRADALDEMQ